MTNFENYINKMIKKIKHSQGVDDQYHWTEVVTVLEEAKKYISESDFKERNL